MPDSTLYLPGLSSLDAEELQEVLGDAVELHQPEVPEGTLAEPVTTLALIKLTAVALGLLAAYLAKPRRRFLVEQTVRISRPDGSVEERRLKFDARSEDEAKQQILTQLKGWFDQGGPAAG